MELRFNRVPGVAQSSDAIVTDFESVKIDDKVATTTFLESASVSVGKASNKTDTVSTYIEELASIKDFLRKPSLIASGAWSTTDGTNANLTNFSIGDLLNTVDVWYQKIKGFNLMRGDFVVRVELNASPFQQGKLLLHYLPCYKQFVSVNSNYGKLKNKDLIQKIQHPNVEIDCRETCVMMRIPYVAPTSWYALKEGYYDWGTVFLDVYSILLTGPSAPAGQNYVDYAIFGYWENFELNAPGVPQSSDATRVVRRGGLAKETDENKGTISDGLRRIGKAANVLSQIPVISDFTTPLAWAANIGADSAAALGWSKPREDKGTTIVSSQTFRYANACDGPDVSLPLGTSTLTRVELFDKGSFTNEDEMSLEYLYRVPFYYAELVWTAALGPGSSLLSKTVSPRSIYTSSSTTDTVGAHTATYNYHVPFTYLSTLFALWRGSIKVTLKFVKTQMHSGRVQVAWTPGTQIVAAPDLTSGSYSLRTIVDIRTEDVVTFTLPYLVFADYLTTQTTGTGSYSGQLDIMVLNALRAPESCSQSVRVQVFFSAGDDFELAAPGTAQASTLPYIPQSDDSELIVGDIHEGNVRSESVIGSKAVKSDSLFHSARCIGERVLSVKQLLNRNSMLMGYNGRYFDAQPYYSPWSNLAVTMTPVTGVLKTSQTGGDIMNYIAPMFAFQRGGIRMAIFYADETTTFKRCSAQLMPGYVFTTADNLVVGNSYFYNASTNVLSSGYYRNNSIVCHTESGEVYVNVPYHARFPMSLNTVWDGTATPGAENSYPINGVNIHNPLGHAGQIVQRSAMEDFQFLFFTGCPPVLSGYV